MEKRKILLAEDDEDDQDFFYHFLETRDDISMLPIAGNGEEVLVLLEKIEVPAEMPDLIILDQNMPKMDGILTLRQLKADDRYRHIPVIIYSTYADEGLKKTAGENGACLVVTKPFTKEGYDQMITLLFNNCI